MYLVYALIETVASALSLCPMYISYVRLTTITCELEEGSSDKMSSL